MGRQGTLPGFLSGSARPTVEIDQCGGATRANPTTQGRLNANHERAYTRPMSNLIAKIRHWLHLEKKPKT